MKIPTPTQLDPYATIDLLRSTQAQIIRQGDDYTADLVGALAWAVGAGTLSTRAAVKTLASLLACPDEAEASRRAKAGFRSMAMTGLVVQLDAIFGEREDVTEAEAAVALVALNGSDTLRPQVAEALRRRLQRPFDDGSSDD
jgi:hypothetical protein